MVDAQSGDPLNLRKNEKKYGAMLSKYWDERDKIPITKEAKGCKVRRVEEGSKTILTLEMIVDDLVPNDYLPFMKNMPYYTVKYDDFCESVEPLVGCGTDYECTKMITKLPWPMWDRYCLTVNYPFIEYAKDEHVFIMAYGGLE
jgi:hypothetical protein